jgi:hypothetical protein
MKPPQLPVGRLRLFPIQTQAELLQVLTWVDPGSARIKTQSTIYMASTPRSRESLTAKFNHPRLPSSLCPPCPSKWEAAGPVFRPITPYGVRDWPRLDLAHRAVGWSLLWADSFPLLVRQISGHTCVFVAKPHVSNIADMGPTRACDQFVLPKGDGNAFASRHLRPKLEVTPFNILVRCRFVLCDQKVTLCLLRLQFSCD